MLVAAFPIHQPRCLHVDMAGPGQDAGHIPKGSRESALWDEDGNVVLFFDFIETQKNIGIGVSICLLRHPKLIHVVMALPGDHSYN